MKKFALTFISVLCILFANSLSAQYFSAMSNWFAMDTRVPDVSNWCPENGTVYMPGQQVFFDYYIMENNLTSLQLGFSSEINGEISIIGTLPSEGPTTITIPQVVTATGKLYIIATDDFGHVNFYAVPQDGYIGIGTAAQQVSIPQGWSGISSVYVPQSGDINTIFSENLDDVIIIQDLENIFWPGGNVFTLTNWDVMQGYLIKTQQAFDMSFEGSTPQCNASAGIEEGWDLIPIVAPCDIDAESFLSWYLWSTDMIKEAAGWRMYWPEYNIKSLEVLERGKAYFVHSWMGNSDFMFGPCWEGEKAIFSEKPDIPEIWNKPVFTPTTHVFAISSQVLTESGIGMNWTLGAFSMNGLCLGVAPAEAFHLTVFADDPSNEVIDGLITGEAVVFRAWNPDKQKEIILTAEFDQSLPNQGNFAENGMSVIKSLKSGTTGIDQLTASEVYLYPNPATDRLMIETNLTGKYQVEISDTKGSVLLKQEGNGNTSLDISSFTGGVYSVKITNGNTIIIRKLLVY